MPRFFLPRRRNGFQNGERQQRLGERLWCTDDSSCLGFTTASLILRPKHRLGNHTEIIPRPQPGSDLTRSFDWRREFTPVILRDFFLPRRTTFAIATIAEVLRFAQNDKTCQRRKKIAFSMCRKPCVATTAISICAPL